MSYEDKDFYMSWEEIMKQIDKIGMMLKIGMLKIGSFMLGCFIGILF